MNDKTFSSIKIYLSPIEKAMIKSISREHGISLSEYCKNRILKSGINFDIITDDLSSVAEQVSEVNDSIISLLTVLKNSDSISPDKIENIEEHLNELNNNCRMLLKSRYRERKEITTDLKAFIQDYLVSK